MQQEQRMKELLELEKQKEKEKEIENQKKIIKKMESMKIRERIKQLRTKFKDYVPQSSAEKIELHVRLPTGKRITQLFEKYRRINFVKDFILQLEDNGIVEEEEEEEDEEEEENFSFDILHGYPPKKISGNVSLAEHFGSSTGEAVTVKLA
jgi:hypothetical protein